MAIDFTGGGGVACFSQGVFRAESTRKYIYIV